MVQYWRWNVIFLPLSLGCKFWDFWWSLEVQIVWTAPIVYHAFSLHIHIYDMVWFIKKGLVIVGNNKMEYQYAVIKGMWMYCLSKYLSKRKILLTSAFNTFSLEWECSFFHLQEGQKAPVGHIWAARINKGYLWAERLDPITQLVLVLTHRQTAYTGWKPSSLDGVG